MLENVRNLANNNISNDEARIKSSDFAKHPSFKGNPNAVDNTPNTDTYTNQVPAPPREMGFGEKFLRYIIPTWGGLHLSTTLYDHVNSGQYEKSFVGRLGRLGDKLAGTRLVRNRFVDSLGSHLSALKTKTQNFIDRHSTLSAMQKTPTTPESPWVTNFLETQNEADFKEASAKIKTFIEKGPETLRDAGASKAEIEAFKRKYGTTLLGRVKNQKYAVQEYLIGKIGADLGNPNLVATIEAREAALAQQLNKLGTILSDPNLTPAQRNFYTNRVNKLSALARSYRSSILRGLKLQSMGLNQSTVQSVLNNPEANGTLVNQAIGSASKYSPKLTKFANKVKSIFEPTSKLGKLFPRLSKLGMRGLTFGGGLFNSLFVAFFLGDAVKNTVDAPKDQKVGTAVHGLMDAMSWVIAMPIALKAMHAVNGLKNLGKSEAQVKAYEAALKTFNQNVKNGLFKTRSQYDKAWNAVETLKNAGTAPTGIKKGLSKVASFLSIGLGQKEPFIRNTSGLKGGVKAAAKWANFKGRLPNFLRNCAGYPLRFALYMFMFEPLVDKVFSGITTALFGKAYDPEKVKEEYDKAHQGDLLKSIMYHTRYSNKLPNKEAVSGLNGVNEENLSDKNIIKQELVKRGIIGNSVNKGPVNNPPQYDSVSGVSIDVTSKDTPDMFSQPGFTNGVNMQQNMPKGADPNKSDYDTVPRSYVPKINWENPVPYDDPMNNPNAEINYYRAQQLLDSSDKIADDVRKYLKGDK